MAGKNRAVFGIYPDRPAVEEAITEFLRAGFRKADISALLPENLGSKDLGHQKSNKAPEGLAVGAIAGGIIGGVLAWLIAMGYLTLPALNSLISAGPVLAMLAGIGAGGILGGILGALIGLGIPEYQAIRFAGRVREGVLMSVHCDNRDWAQRAKAIFEDSGAQDVAATHERSGDFGNADKPRPRVRTVAGSDVITTEERPIVEERPVVTDHKPYHPVS